ncbi:MAG: hypothetical protein JXR03_16890 [Cyclobacteriaceae bacterium]
MIKILKQIAFFGGIIITFLGLVLIMIVNETGHSPVWLVNIMTSIIFVSGISILIVITKKGMHG